MIPDGKNAWRHLANKNRTSESDINDKFALIKILKEKFGLYGLTGEALEIPPGGHASHRLPDVFVKNNKPRWILELDGLVHGYGDEISKRWFDVEKDYDLDLYCAAHTNTIKQHISYASTNGYQREKVIELLIQAGMVPIDKA